MRACVCVVGQILGVSDGPNSHFQNLHLGIDIANPVNIKAIFTGKAIYRESNSHV